jgi:dynein heavy chain
MSSWCLQELGSKANRRKIETLVTIHVHQVLWHMYID